MQKHILLYLIVHLAFINYTAAQQIIQTDHSKKTQSTILSQIPSFGTAQAFLWDQANKQQGVIGSDFHGKQEIGNAAAERSKGGIDFWFPLDNYKKTFGGILESVKISDLSGEGYEATGFIDLDHNFHLKPIEDFQSQFDEGISKAILRMHFNDPTVDPSHTVEAGWFDCRENMLNRRIKDLECEIDLSKSNVKKYIAHNKPQYLKELVLGTNPDTVFTYGPWISDAGHCFKPEIHPAEQIWRRRRSSANAEQILLLLSCDESGRYRDEDDFDANEVVGPDRYLKNVWAPAPLKGSFSLLFAVKKGEQIAQFDISKIDGQNIQPTTETFQHYYLLANKDTLVKVNYTGSDRPINIRFEQIFSGLGDASSNTIYGFMTIEATVGNKSADAGGYLLMNINKKMIFVPHQIFSVPK